MFGKKRPDNTASDHILATVRCISETFYYELVWARHLLSAWKIWCVVLFFVAFTLGIIVDDLDNVKLPSWLFYALLGSFMVAFPLWLFNLITKEK